MLHANLFWYFLPYAATVTSVSLRRLEFLPRTVDKGAFGHLIFFYDHAKRKKNASVHVCYLSTLRAQRLRTVMPTDTFCRKGNSLHRNRPKALPAKGHRIARSCEHTHRHTKIIHRSAPQRLRLHVCYRCQWDIFVAIISITLSLPTTHNALRLLVQLLSYQWNRNQQPKYGEHIRFILKFADVKFAFGFFNL